MTSRQRLNAVFSLKEPDITPILGGWIAAPNHVMALSGVNAETYWDDPVSISIQAYRTLRIDGLIDVFVPKNRDDFRRVDQSTYQSAAAGMSLEEAVSRIDRMPSHRAVEKSFDFEKEYEVFRSSLESMQKRCGDLSWFSVKWNFRIFK